MKSKPCGSCGEESHAPSAHATLHDTDSASILRHDTKRSQNPKPASAPSDGGTTQGCTCLALGRASGGSSGLVISVGKGAPVSSACSRLR